MNLQRYLLLVSTGLCLSLPTVSAYEDEPINYSQATPNNRIAKLQQQIESGAKRLGHEQPHGYLKALLRELDIPVSSQVLTFSQTSLQRPKISPQTPRAIYFNDDAYVGYVQDGLLEIAVADPQLGMVFYTQDQIAVATPALVRGTNQCLTCHGALKTRNVPGVQVRSVFVDELGEPIVSLGSFRVDHSTPLAQRWGGWYVTGAHGQQKHLGNLVGPKVKKRDEIDNAANMNVTDLRSRLKIEPYLSPHSDLIALMVLDHQADLHNLLTKTNFDTRIAQHTLAQAKQSGDLPAALAEKQQAKIQAAAESLVRALLFCNEAPLTEPLTGTSDFAREFAAHGPRDGQDRSLRDFDLRHRLFRYPCSYMIYSPAFDALPAESKTLVYHRLLEILSERDRSPTFAHLTPTARQAILAILRETKRGLPDNWR